jgi:hypothetical protein
MMIYKHLTVVILLVMQCLAAQPVLWHRTPSSNLGAAMQVVVDQSGTIFASVYMAGIYRTQDSGATWKQVAPHTDGLWTLALLPDNNVAASLWSKGLFRSTNSGDTWTVMTPNKIHSDLRLVAPNGNIFIEAEGTLQRSTDQGKTWVAAPIGAGVMAMNGDTLFAAKGSAMYRSINNGGAWIPYSSLSSSIYALNVSPQGSLLAGTHHQENGSEPSIFSYIPSTNSWKGTGPLSTINALLYRKDGTIFAASHDSGFYASTDQGRTWKQINHGLTATKIYSLAFLSDTMIVAGTLDGVFITKNLHKALSVQPEQTGNDRVAAEFLLMQNYPNPFNPSTEIEFHLPFDGHVSLRVFDLLGRKISELLNEDLRAGAHGIRFNASSLSSGIYFYRLTAQSSQTGNIMNETRTMILQR